MHPCCSDLTEQERHLFEQFWGKRPVAEVANVLAEGN